MYSNWLIELVLTAYKLYNRTILESAGTARAEKLIYIRTISLLTTDYMYIYMHWQSRYILLCSENCSGHNADEDSVMQSD